MEQVYGYLTGPRFHHRVEAIVEKFSDMQEDLAKERKAITRPWAKREAQIQGVIESTVGMYSDLQGSSRFSRSKAFSFVATSEGKPARTPLSRSAFFTHSCSVCAVQPILAAIDETAAHREACSPS